MYNKAISGIAVFYLILFVCFWCAVGIEVRITRGDSPKDSIAVKQDFNEENRKEYNNYKTIGISASGKRTIGYQMIERTIGEEADLIGGNEDFDALCRIVEAEAGSEDEDGRLLVANVVLNRVNSDQFPNTILEVVLQQKDGKTQFSPVGSGRFYQVEVTEKTYAAVKRALNGEDISQGALFFVSRKRANAESLKWFEENLKFLFEHGGHEFYGIWP